MTEPFHDQVTRLAGEFASLSPKERDSRLETLAMVSEELRRAVEAELGESTMESHPDSQPTTSPWEPSGSEKSHKGSMLGMTLGSCHLKRLIAEGGMGAVYEAVQDPFGRAVAVKLMKTGLVSAEARHRFNYEARLLATLAHPGIAQVFDSGVCHSGAVSVPYIVMELVPHARTLAAFVRDEQLNEREICEVFLQVCDAVHYAHQHGVIHRDLKPANILVDNEGRPRVIDFGVAHVDTSQEVTRSFETRADSIVGTLPYMSPEQVTANEPVDIRSDEYSLGVILYELLTGHRPYALDRSSLAQAVEVIRGAAPTRPSRVRPDLSPDLETIVLKALRKDRSERYRSVDDFAEDLRRFLAGLPIQARPTSFVYQARLFARRHRALVTLSCVFICLLMGATIFSLMKAREAGDAARREARAAGEARKLRDQALRLLKESSAFSEWVVVDFLNDMATLPGGTPLAEKLTRRVVEYLDAMNPAVGIDPELERSIALAYMEVGSVLGSPSRPSLGRRREAIAYLKKAEKLLRRRWEEDPSPRRALDYAAVRLVLADVLHSFGQVEAAADIHAEGVRMLEAVKNGGALEARIQQLLADYLRDWGLMLAAEGDTQGATRRLGEAIELRRRLQAEKDSDQLWRQLLIDQTSLAQVLLSAGKAKEAEDILRPLLPQVDARKKRDPRAADDAAGLRFQLADAVSMQQGRQEEALDLFKEVLAIRRRLLKGDESNVSRLESLAAVLERCATMTTALSQDVAKGLPFSEEVAALSRRIYQQSPDSFDHMARLRIALGSLGAMLNMLHRQDEAIATVAECLELSAKMLKKRPESLSAQRAMAESLTLKGHVSLGEAGPNPPASAMKAAFEKALDCYRRGRDIYLKLKERFPEAPWLERSLEAQDRCIQAVAGALESLEGLERP